jgi:hypothetical protein
LAQSNPEPRRAPGRRSWRPSANSISKVRWNALYELIYTTPAAGLVGVAVKLALLTDDAIGLSESCSG